MDVFLSVRQSHRRKGWFKWCQLRKVDIKALVLLFANLVWTIINRYQSNWSLIPIGRGQRELIIGIVKQVKLPCYWYYLQQKKENDRIPSQALFVFIVLRSKKKFYCTVQHVLNNTFTLLSLFGNCVRRSPFTILSPYTACTLENFLEIIINTRGYIWWFEQTCYAYRQMSLLYVDRQAWGLSRRRFLFTFRLLERAAKLASGGSLTAYRLSKLSRRRFRIYSN